MKYLEKVGCDRPIWNRCKDLTSSKVYYTLMNRMKGPVGRPVDLCKNQMREKVREYVRWNT